MAAAGPAAAVGDRIEEIFTPGTHYDLPVLGAVEISVERRGPLRLPTGRVVAADPGWLTEQEPFTETVPPGEYPVLIAQAGGSKTVLGAKLVILHAPVASWELARREGQSLIELGDGQFYGFGVDSGQGCFCDAADITFNTGYGDGSYPTWIGRTTDGKVACFVADMLILRKAFEDGAVR